MNESLDFVVLSAIYFSALITFIGLINLALKLSEKIHKKKSYRVVEIRIVDKITPELKKIANEKNI